MLFKRLIGTVDVIISTADSPALLNALLKNGITVLKSSGNSFSLKAKIYFTDIRKLKRTVSGRGEKLERVKRKGGILSLLYLYRLRYGIAIGFLLSMFISIYLSNTLLEIKVKGADDKTTQEILNVLKEEGVEIGSFLPSINRLKLECAILDSTSTVALVNSRVEGSALCFDIKVIDEAPELEHERLGADIVSTKDAVITKCEVYLGNQIVSVGESVKKGDTLVSGDMTLRGKMLDISKDVRFHSSGKIYGDYNESVSFYVPFEDVEQSLLDSGEDYSISFFSANIPANIFSGSHSGERKISKTTNLNLFGIKLPIGITANTYSRLVETSIARNENEAFSTAYDRIEIYENNILEDVTILSKTTEESVSDSGVTVTVNYRLNGEIGETAEILEK